VFQLAPFPFDLVKQEIFKYPNAELQWVQEDHKNMGAWLHVQPRVNTAVSGAREISYVGRAVSASPATGGKHQYNRELEAFLSEAMAL
jgi:2-oxoglutarate dehydrogenase E1 component